jgi:HAD superfamily hydrolase (TIGR01662 family)
MENGCIKAVFFDLDGTLRHNLPSGGEVFTEYAASLGLSISQEDRERAVRWEHYYWASSLALNNDLKQFEHDSTGFWQGYSYRRLLALCGSPSLAAELAPQVNKYMEENYKPHAYVLPGTLETVQKLQHNGIRLGVLSNRHNPFREELEMLGLSEYFPFALAGGEVDLWKPSPEIFHYVAKQVNVKPAELVYVGDNFFADVVGAQRAGVHAVLFDPHGIFPDPGCPVIKSFAELPALVEKLKPCRDET